MENVNGLLDCVYSAPNTEMIPSLSILCLLHWQNPHYFALCEGS